MPETELREDPGPAASSGARTPPPPLPGRQAGSVRRRRSGPEGTKGTIAKIVLLGLVDALAVYVLMMLFLSQSWLALAVSAAVVLVINWIYLRKGGLPAKYLAPGVLFLLVFQVFVVMFSGYIAFTNYGDGHNSTKDDAIAAIQLTAQKRVPDSPAYKTAVLAKDNSFYLLFTDPHGKVSLGSTEKPLEEVSGAGKDSTGKAKTLDGYRTLNFQEIVANQQ